MLAEKSVSSLTGFNGVAQQQAATLTKGRSDALSVSISTNPTEDESHISFSLQKAQHIRKFLQK
ncbi:MAG: hypothetical protein MUF71_11830 [Candidatus Kapabacteria bacterium]|jgi:hypothetical protein|nr:hypothetical protein [Candidatus Kapabacteria bacterium]